MPPLRRIDHALIDAASRPFTACSLGARLLAREAAAAFGLSRGATRALRRLVMLGDGPVPPRHRDELLTSGALTPALLDFDEPGGGWLVAGEVHGRIRAARAVGEVTP